MGEARKFIIFTVVFIYTILAVWNLAGNRKSTAVGLLTTLNQTKPNQT